MLRSYSRPVLLISLFLVSCLTMIGCNRMNLPAALPEGSPSSGTPTTLLTISAAASLKDALTDLKQVYINAHPEVTLRYNFGASGALQQQIEQGAPVDVFISAATKQMNALQAKGQLWNQTRKNLLSNQVVLITPANGIPIKAFQDLSSDRIKQIAIGQPDSVPVGKYAEEVLKTTGILEQVKSKLVFAKDVRQVLSYVETGNVDAGIVYISDTKVSNKINVVAIASNQSHSPIVYPIAVLKDSKNPAAAQAFVQFLTESQAQSMFEKYGFIPSR